MTKNFCDKCGIEVNDSEYIKISFLGNINKHFGYKQVQFCEKCFTEVDKELERFIPKISSISNVV